MSWSPIGLISVQPVLVTEKGTDLKDPAAGTGEGGMRGITDGKGQMADGKGQMADGKGRWQMAKGRWQRARMSFRRQGDAEVAEHVAPDGVDVVGAVLGVVELDQEGRAPEATKSTVTGCDLTEDVESLGLRLD
jgi:hypothetical protein